MGRQMCYITVTRLKIVWRARNTLVTRASRGPNRDPRRDIRPLPFSFRICFPRVERDRVQLRDP